MQTNFNLLIIVIILLISGCTKIVYRDIESKTQGYMPSIIDFGAIPNDNISDTKAFKIAIAQGVKDIYLPSGVYDIDETLELPNDIRINGAPNATIRAIKSMNVAITMTSPNYSIQNFNISNIIIDGNNKAINCVKIYKVSGTHQEIVRNVQCINALEDGAVFRACQVSSIYNLSFRSNGGNGAVFDGCNGIMIHNISASLNKKSGIKINYLEEGAAKYSAGLNIYGLHSEGNKGDGVSFNGLVTPASIFGGWIEGNTGNGVVVNDANVNLFGIRISGNCFPNKSIYPVNITKNKTPFGSNVVVENCFIVNGQSELVDVFNANKPDNVVIRNVKKYNHIQKQK
ncbi:MAG: glycosyl hydrolase family 28-related protein [Saprospiraceae bacterium]